MSKSIQVPGDPGAHISDPGKDYRRARGIPVIPALDGFRAFAILGIVLFHLFTISLVLTGGGARTLTYGVFPNLVQVLFVISGFVVFLPTVARLGEFGSIRSYALRRAARLLPAYWLVIVVVLVLIVAWPQELEMPGASEVLLHLSMLHVPAALFDHGYEYGLLINGPLWTLSLELTFYVLLPLIAGAYFRRPLLGLAIAAAVTVLWKLGIQHADSIADALGIGYDGSSIGAFRIRADNQFPAFAFAFAAGMTAAWAYVRLPARIAPAELARRAVPVQLASLLVLAVFAYLIGRYAVTTGDPRPHAIALRSPLLSLGFAGSLATFMLATTLAPRKLQMPFATPFARSLGDISYGIYLIHFPLVFFFWTLFIVEGGIAFPSAALLAAVAITAVPLSIAYGYLSARLLEQPIRRWAHRFGRRTQAGERPRERTEPAVTVGEP